MQTRYYTTENFIRHNGNVVDLTEYRRKLALAGSGREEPSGDEAPLSRSSICRAKKSKRSGLLLDACASMVVVVMTLTFTLRVLTM